LPSWTNPNYCIAIAESETAKASSFDWQPKDVGFRINGQDNYLYDIKLSAWTEYYKIWEPKPDDQRYWDIKVMFNQPVTKKSRGATEREWIETHQIILDLGKNTSNYQLGVQNHLPSTPLIDNNMGMVECQASRSVCDGVISPNDYAQIIYEFWDDTVTWPWQVTMPKASNQTGQNSSGLGNLHSYLTPMDNDTDWWNLFLDGENGILSMDAGRASAISSNYEVFEGWNIGWDFAMMDSIIQKAKIRGKPWAENLTLQDYTKKVYPSETVNTYFHPKKPKVETEIGGPIRDYNSYYHQNHERPIQRGAQVGPWTDLGPEKSFLPVSGYEAQATRGKNRYMRRNQYNGKAYSEQEYDSLITQTLQPTLGLESNENYLAAVANDEGYEVIGVQQNHPQITQGNNNINPRVELSRLRNSALTSVIEVGAVYPHTQNHNNSFTVMEQIGGNLVAVPDYNPYIESWTSEEWTEAVNSTGYSNQRGATIGNNVSMRAVAEGREYEPRFNSVPKIFLTNLPGDSLEVEEMPSNFEGRPIDYSMPTGNPWRRGKIFMINWVSILSRKVLQMLQPPEE